MERQKSPQSERLSSHRVLLLSEKNVKIENEKQVRENGERSQP